MICLSNEHPENAQSPIEVTDDGIVICVNVEQSLNILFKIFRISPAIINDFIPLKTFFPIEVTEEGIVICDNDEHPEKA